MSTNGLYKWSFKLYILFIYKCDRDGPLKHKTVFIGRNKYSNYSYNYYERLVKLWKDIKTVQFNYFVSIWIYEKANLW